MITAKMRRRVDILLGDDGSPSSLAAIDLLKDLPVSRSALPKSTVTVIEVMDTPEAFDSVLRLAELEQAKTLLEGGALKVKTELMTGRPAQVLIRRAGQLHPDFILIGAKGWRAGVGFLLGNVAQEVVEQADWPVLVVRAPYHGLRRVLLAVDGSPNSLYAASFLARFPLPASARLEVLCVRPPEPRYTSLPPVWTVAYPPAPAAYLARFPVDEVETWKVEEHEALLSLERAIAILKAEGYRARGVLLQGEATAEILAYSRDFQADLIVVGGHGQNVGISWSLGNVARKLVHSADCSVLVVKGYPSADMSTL